MTVGGVALEIALQRGFFLGNGQFVIRQGEVVHADVAVTGFGQLLDGVLQHLQLVGRGRQITGIDPALWHEALRQVRVIEHRQTIRLQINHFVDRARKCLGRLFR